MPARFAALALAGSLALAGCSSAPSLGMNDPADIAAVSALRDNFQKAVNAGDAEGVAKLFTEDGTSQANHQATATGRAAIAAAQKSMFDQFSAQLQIMPEETHTMDHMGFDRGHYTMTLTPKAGGAPVKDEGRYIVLLEKTDAGWAVTADLDNSTLPMPAPPAAEPAKAH